MRTKFQTSMLKLLLFIIILFYGSTTFALTEKMVFWYPGESGTTKEAQPVLDAFTDYVSGKLATTKITGKYFNTTEEGLSFITGQKPTIGIISYAAWEENKSRFPNAQVWLATNPLPHGQKQENYLLVGRTLHPLPHPPPSRGRELQTIPSPLAGEGQGEGVVFSSEPLSMDFIKNQLGFDVETKPQATSQILMKLKSIADGTTAGAAILSPTEGATFTKMTAPWTKQLKVIAKSKPVPTARVVLFAPLPKDGEKLKQVLLNLRSDPEAKEILEELRLVGFSEP